MKTRLCPPLDGVQAAACQAAFLSDTLASLEPLAGDDLEILLAASPDEGAANLEALAARFGFGLVGQGEGDLGQRMACLSRAGLAAAGRVVLVGADYPHMPPGRVLEALEALQTHPLVLGPSEDGGYYLIGLAGREALVPAFTPGIPWGSTEVAAVTREHLRVAGLEWAELAEGWDVDRAGDLERLASLLDGEPQGRLAHTRAVCASLRAAGVLA